MICHACGAEGYKTYDASTWHKPDIGLANLCNKCAHHRPSFEAEADIRKNRVELTTCESCGGSSELELKDYHKMFPGGAAALLGTVKICRACLMTPLVTVVDNITAERKTGAREVARGGTATTVTTAGPECSCCEKPADVDKGWVGLDYSLYIHGLEEQIRAEGVEPEEVRYMNICTSHGRYGTVSELVVMAAKKIAKKKGSMSKTTKLGWSEIEKILDSGAASRVLLFGPPGTGKSHAGVTRKAKENEVKTFSITLTPEQSAAELRGHFVPKGNKFVWIDGPAVAAWRCGGRLVLNEIDQASSDVMTLLHVILDDPDFARLTLPNEDLEEVRPAAGFTVVATTNADNPQAVLPAALFDRFPVQVRVDEPNPEAIKTLPKDLQAAAQELAAHKDPARRVGLRSWQAFAKLREKLGAEIAAKAVFKDRAFDVINGLAIGKAR